METRQQENEPIQNAPARNFTQSTTEAAPKPDKKIIIGGIIVIVLALAAIGAGAYWWWQNEKAPSQRACTMEAKICPDGSSVGRTGPNCEFAACPSGGSETCKNLCGDGTCQEIVCMAIGCPCAETAQSCPQDCAKNEVEGWQTYRNEEYGFEVKILPTWENYSVKRKVEIDSSSWGVDKNGSPIIQGKVVTYTFELPTMQPDVCQDNKCLIFSLSVFSNEQAEKINFVSGPFGPSIARNDNFTFVLTGTSQDPPLDLIKFRKDVNQILSTFKFIEPAEIINVKVPEGWPLFSFKGTTGEYNPTIIAYKSFTINYPFRGNIQNDELNFKIDKNINCLMTILDKPVGCEGPECETTEESREVVINGVPWNVLMLTWKDSGKMWYYAFKLDSDSNYSFSIDPATANQCLSSYYEILSTLKFTNSLEVSADFTNEQIWKPICQVSEEFTVKAEVGDGQTNLARKALTQYLLEASLKNLVNKTHFEFSTEEKVYAEDYIVKNSDLKNLKVKPDASTQVSCELVEKAALKARLLTIGQKENLDQYSQRVAGFNTEKLLMDIVNEIDKEKPADLNIQIFNLN